MNDELEFKLERMERKRSWHWRMASSHRAEAIADERAAHSITAEMRKLTNASKKEEARQQRPRKRRPVRTTK